jgi:hypothetical protein
MPIHHALNLATPPEVVLYLLALLAGLGLYAIIAAASGR